MDSWGDAASWIAGRDRRTPAEIRRSLRAGLDFLAEWWTLDPTGGGAVTDVARDAIALFIAGGGDPAGLVEACGRLPVIHDEPTVGQRGQVAGVAPRPPVPAGQAGGHACEWGNGQHSCRTCGSAPPTEQGRRFYPDASRDPAFLDAEYTDDD